MIDHFLVPDDEGFEEDKAQVMREISMLETGDLWSLEIEKDEIQC